MTALERTGTAWQAGSLHKAVLFGRTWEDPGIERSAFDGADRVLCIASAGCTPRVLSARHRVVAVDINPVQLAYARRRLAGGAPQRGTAEHAMAAARAFLPLAGIKRSALAAFMALDDPEVQRQAWQRLCTRRFRLGMDVMFSFTALRAVYASPFLERLPARYGRVLASRFARTFATHPNIENPYARAMFLGESADEPGPAPGDIELVCADAASYLETRPAGSFDAASLSNILDGASPEYRARLLRAVLHAVRPQGTVVLRSFAEPHEPADGEAAARDRSMIWGSVSVRSAESLSPDQANPATPTGLSA